MAINPVLYPSDYASSTGGTAGSFDVDPTEIAINDLKRSQTLGLTTVSSAGRTAGLMAVELQNHDPKVLTVNAILPVDIRYLRRLSGVNGFFMGGSNSNWHGTSLAKNVRFTYATETALAAGFVNKSRPTNFGTALSNSKGSAYVVGGNHRYGSYAGTNSLFNFSTETSTALPAFTMGFGAGGGSTPSTTIAMSHYNYYPGYWWWHHRAGYEYGISHETHSVNVLRWVYNPSAGSLNGRNHMYITQVNSYCWWGGRPSSSVARYTYSNLGYSVVSGILQTSMSAYAYLSMMGVTQPDRTTGWFFFSELWGSNFAIQQMNLETETTTVLSVADAPTFRLQGGGGNLLNSGESAFALKKPDKVAKFGFASRTLTTTGASSTYTDPMGMSYASDYVPGVTR